MPRMKNWGALSVRPGVPPPTAATGSRNDSGHSMSRNERPCVGQINNVGTSSLSPVRFMWKRAFRAPE
eukprot:1340850-Pyramimonas_sp.AAC.1